MEVRRISNKALIRLMAKEGRIDILVNNAGVNVYGPIVELSMEDVRALFGAASAVGTC